MKKKKIQAGLALMLGFFAIVYPSCYPERRTPGVDSSQLTQWHQEFWATQNAELKDVRATNQALQSTLESVVFETPQP